MTPNQSREASEPMSQGRDLPDEPGVWSRDQRTWLIHIRPGCAKDLYATTVLDDGYLQTLFVGDDFPRGNWLKSQPPAGEVREELERLREESQWIRKKLNLHADTPFVSGNGETLAGTMHVVCDHAHGYVTYIAAHKCDDKQGEIARLTVAVKQAESRLAELERDVKAATAGSGAFYIMEDEFTGLANALHLEGYSPSAVFECAPKKVALLEQQLAEALAEIDRRSVHCPKCSSIAITSQSLESFDAGGPLWRCDTCGHLFDEEIDVLRKQLAEVRAGQRVAPSASAIGGQIYNEGTSP